MTRHAPARWVVLAVAVLAITPHLAAAGAKRDALPRTLHVPFTTAATISTTSTSTTQSFRSLGAAETVLDPPIRTALPGTKLSTSSSLRERWNDKYAVSYLEVEEAELAQDTAEVYAALERRFKDVSAGLSMGACVKRAKQDIAMAATTDMESQTRTSMLFMIINAVATPLVMLFVAPLIIKLMMLILDPIASFLSPRVVKACGNYMSFLIIPIMDATLGTYLQAQLSKSLSAKLGILLMDAFVHHIPRVLGRDLPPQMTNYVLRVESSVIAKDIAHRVIHTLTHTLTHSISRTLPRVVASKVEKQLSHNLVNYYYCIWCYETGQFCNYCHAYLTLKVKQESGNRAIGKM